ncbi:hypothetical protein C1646_672307 [Rhizophagus diaphanus]|nr:hypothetical protein C1646_672307 [Rhizophagus diaphanus] [Rhizophagus sp. MUCL 43196]
MFYVLQPAFMNHDVKKPLTLWTPRQIHTIISPNTYISERPTLLQSPNEKVANKKQYQPQRNSLSSSRNRHTGHISRYSASLDHPTQQLNKLKRREKIGYAEPKNAIRKGNPYRLLYYLVLPGTLVYITKKLIILTFDYEVRRRYDVITIQQYNYGCAHAIQLYHLYNAKSQLSWKMLRTNLRLTCVTPYQKKDQEIINDPKYPCAEVRTHPPNNDSHTTMSDNSYVSAAESVATIIYPPTLAKE